MNICTKCRKELKIGQRVIPNHILVEPPEGSNFEAKLSDLQYQHSDCYLANGPGYDKDGKELPYLRKRYDPDIAALE